MKPSSTLFLKGVIVLMVVIVAAISIFGFPVIIREASNYIELPQLQYPLLLDMYAAVIAFLIALYQGLRLLTYIDNNKAFSELSVKALTNTKYSATAISFFLALHMPVVYLVAEKDDAPGLILFAMAFVFAPAVIAVFAAVLQRLFQEAINIKSENELTV